LVLSKRLAIVSLFYLHDSIYHRRYAMSYKYSKGPTVQGDIAARPDVQRDTKINFEEDYIALEASGSAVLVVSGSKVGVGLTNPSHKFDVNGDIRVRGNDIRDNSGNPAISFDGSANTTIVNNLTVQDYTFPASDGNADQVLQTNGSGQLSFASVSGGGSGGKVLQAVNVFYTGSFETNSTTYVVVADEGIDGAGPFQAKITPSSTSSKLFILATLSVGVRHNQYALAKIRVNIAGAGGGNFFPLGGEGIQASHEDDITFGTLSTDNNGFERNIPYTIHSIIEPNTTMPVRVVFQLKTLNSSYAARVNKSTGNANNKSDSPSVSSITIFELDGS
jgi:hypothetical protein